MEHLEAELLHHINRFNSYRNGFRESKRRNINPKIWGAPGWKFIDKIVEGYPVKASSRDKMHMLEFLISLGHVLPCEKCRDNHIRFSMKHPPSKYIGGRASVRKWIRMYKNINRN